MIHPAQMEGGAWNVFLPAGGNVAGRDFGFVAADTGGQFENATISGVLFDDDGAGSPGIAGVTVYLDLNDDAIRQFDEPRTITHEDDPSTTGVDETGQYSFAGLGNRNYTDTASNPNLVAVELSITVDRTPPQATLTSTEPNPTTSDSFELNIDFGQSVTGFTLEDLQVDGATARDLVDANDGQYSVTINVTSHSSLQVDIASGAAADLAGNPNQSSETFEIMVQSTEPPLSGDGLQAQINFSAGQLSDDVYQLELLTSLTGGGSIIITGDSQNKFYVLTGDWNGSGGVNIQDFSGLAANFGKSITFPSSLASVTAGEGEFDALAAITETTREANADDIVAVPRRTSTVLRSCGFEVIRSQERLKPSLRGNAVADVFNAWREPAVSLTPDRPLARATC